MPNTLTPKPTCKYPGCNRGAQSRGNRGKNSSVKPNGSKYFAWCHQHRKGKLKDERIQYTNNANNNMGV